MIVDLLKVKWNSFVKRTFYTHLLIFTLYFLLSSCCFVMRGTTPNSEDAANCTLGMAENVTNDIQQPLRKEHLLLENNMTGTRGDGASDTLGLIATTMADIQNYNFLEMNLDNNTGNTNQTIECPDESASNSCFHNTYDVLDKQVSQEICTELAHYIFFLDKTSFGDCAGCLVNIVYPQSCP